MVVIEAMLRAASGHGTIAALIVAVVFAMIGYAGGMLTHGVTAREAYWFAVKGGVFGSWLVFTPFVLWSVFRK